MVCVGGVLGDLLPWPIKWGFAFDSVLKETDEPAELHDFLLGCHFLFPPPALNSCQIFFLVQKAHIHSLSRASILSSPLGF